MQDFFLQDRNRTLGNPDQHYMEEYSEMNMIRRVKRGGREKQFKPRQALCSPNRGDGHQYTGQEDWLFNGSDIFVPLANLTAKILSSASGFSWELSKSLDLPAIQDALRHHNLLWSTRQF